MRDMISNNSVAFLGTLTLSGTTAATSDYIDTLGFNAASIVMVNKTITDAGTAAGFTATLQESDDATAAGAGSVSDAETTGGTNALSVTSDAADDQTAGAIGYNGSKRYIGFSVAGTTGTDATVDVYALLGKPSKAPTVFAGTGVART